MWVYCSAMIDVYASASCLLVSVYLWVFWCVACYYNVPWICSVVYKSYHILRYRIIPQLISDKYIWQQSRNLSLGLPKSLNHKFLWNMYKYSSWIKINQLDVTRFIISTFTAQHVSNVSTPIFRSLRLICGFISCVLLLWFDVCWCYGVVRLGWCGILMQAEALLQPA